MPVGGLYDRKRAEGKTSKKQSPVGTTNLRRRLSNHDHRRKTSQTLRPLKPVRHQSSLQRAHEPLKKCDSAQRGFGVARDVTRCGRRDVAPRAAAKELDWIKI
jgi:hypothetical protein